MAVKSSERKEARGAGDGERSDDVELVSALLTRTSGRPPWCGADSPPGPSPVCRGFRSRRDLYLRSSSADPRMRRIATRPPTIPPTRPPTN